MKNIKIITFLIILLLSVTACNWDQYEINPVELTSEVYFNKPEDFNKTIIGAYGYITTPRAMGAAGIGTYMTRSDEGVSGADYGLPGAFNNKFGPSWYTVQQMWQYLYTSIYACNNVIANEGNLKWNGVEDLRNAYLGEAYFLRAFNHLFLLTHWRNIILDIENPLDNTDLYKKQSEPTVVWDQIVLDLQMAQTLLPKTGFWPAEYKGRATMGSATALLGKVHLWRSGIENENYYTEAAKEFDKVISGECGFYALVNYEENFFEYNENNDESLFELQFKGDMDVNTDFQIMEGSSTAGNWNDPRGVSPMGYQGSSSVAVHQWLMDAFLDSRDNDGNIDPRVFSTLVFDADTITKREGMDVFTYNKAGFNNIYRVRKDGVGNIQHDNKGREIYEGYRGDVSKKNDYSSVLGISSWDNDYSASNIKFCNRRLDYFSSQREGSANWRFLRLGDVYLMYAEACLESGYTGSISATEAVNAVRLRPGVNMPTFTSVTMDDVKRERILECSMEGHRFFDLLRWGEVEERFIELETNDPYFKKFPNETNEYLGISGNVDKYKWLPIPSTEMAANPYVKQNPAWQ